MNISISRDEFGHLVCAAEIDGRESLVIASNPTTAGLDLMAAIEDARRIGIGECLWMNETGEYRWLLRRNGLRVTVVALRSRGTVTGWEHVVYAETEFEPFAAHITDQLARACSASGISFS